MGLRIGGMLLAALVGLAVAGTGDAAGQEQRADGTYTIKKVPKSVAKPPVGPPAALAPPPPIIKMPAVRRRPAAAPVRVAPGASSSPDTAPVAQTAPVPAGNGVASAAEEMAIQAMGLEKARSYVDKLSDVAKGNGSWLFDGARLREKGVAGPSGTSFFGLGGGSPVQATGSAKPIDTSTSEAIVKTYEGVPGGVVLEGAARFEPISDLTYDARFNALILNDTLVYFLRAPPTAVATLVRAIAGDPRVGVSLGDVHLVYGKVDPASGLAYEMKLADNFLGEIVFADRYWTKGYRLADDYTPKRAKEETQNVAVFFSFNRFQFEVEKNEIRLAGINLDVRVVPLENQRSEKGDLLPDTDAIARGAIPEPYRLNAEHIAGNLDYYRRERIIGHMFEYGAVAAFLRGLAGEGFDLKELARAIEAQTR